MKITITAQVDPDLADPDNDTGLTSEAYDEITEGLIDAGLTEIRIVRA